MAEREFDWPERMPEGFWEWLSPFSARAHKAAYGLIRSPYETDWLVNKFGVGDGWATPLAESLQVEQDAYTALRDHVLREREEKAATCLDIPDNSPNLKETLTDSPQPPERAEFDGLRTQLAKLQEDFRSRIAELAPPDEKEGEPYWVVPDGQLSSQRAEREERPWKWDVRYDFDSGQVWRAMNWLADRQDEILERIGNPETDVASVLKEAAECDRFDKIVTILERLQQRVQTLEEAPND